MALEAFRKIQWGVQADNTVEAAATRIGIGTMTVTPTQEWHRPQDERTSLAEYRRAAIVGQGSTITYEGSATYEQIIDLFANSIIGGQTPVTDTNAETWTFLPVLTTRSNQDALTIEYGDDSTEWTVINCFTSSLELGMVLNDVVTVRAEMFGQFPIKKAITGALTDDTVEEIVANTLKVYIDNTGTWPATTQKTSLVAGATWRLNTGLVSVTYANGSIESHSAVMEQRRHLELDLDFAMGAAATTEYDAAVAAGGTTRNMRLQIDGTNVTSPPASTPKSLKLDITGKYLDPPEIFGVRDGENLLSMTLASHEDSTPNEFQAIVLNEESSLANTGPA